MPVGRKILPGPPMWRNKPAIIEPPPGPNWTIRDNLEIWQGGCIDSLEDLEGAEQFLRCMKPLMQEKEAAANPLSEEEHPNVST